MSSSIQEKSNHEIEFNFFSELSACIKYASILDSELNRKLAREFNIFDFLRDDEIGLSQIIAHLLNPLASHGQGTFFLQHFLKFTTKETDWEYLDSKTVNVETEHSTYEGRRIDIYVEIWRDKPFVLAIENKPYAGDQDNQVLDYLKYLDKKSSDYLLVYLSSDGEGPSESSFPKENRNRWIEKFTVMAYTESGDDLDEYQDTEDESSNDQHNEANQDVSSLATWLKVCKEKCEVDRLRWFLGDAENFCTKTFGNSKSSDNVEVQIVESFLLENPKYLNTAHAVKEAWPYVVNKVVEPFFQHFADVILDKLAERKDIQRWIKPSFEGDGYIYLCLYSENWIQYEHPDRCDDTDGRYCIYFGNDIKNKPDWWHVGVRSPIEKTNMNDVEKTRFKIIKERLDQEIPGKENDHRWFPRYEYVDSKKRDWEPNLETLLDETNREKGDDSKFTEYYVNFFWKFANKAIGILDEIEKHP